MSIPFPELHLHTEVSGNTCCSNNRRVVYSDSKDLFYVDRIRPFNYLFRCCLNGDVERDEKANTWEALDKKLQGRGLSLDVVARQALQVDSSQLSRMRSRLAPGDFQQIVKHVRSIQSLPASNSRVPQELSFQMTQINIRVKNSDGTFENFSPERVANFARKQRRISEDQADLVVREVVKRLCEQGCSEVDKDQIHTLVEDSVAQF